MSHGLPIPETPATPPVSAPATPVTLTAFWHYDRYPFILSGTVVKSRDDGAVFIHEYGGWFKPLTVMPDPAGKVIADKLKALRKEHDDEVHRVKLEFALKAARIAPFVSARMKAAHGGKL